MITIFIALLVGTIDLSLSSVITYSNQPLIQAPVIDLTTNGASTVLYVRYCEWYTYNGSTIRSTKIVSMKRYCYCTETMSKDPNENSCSIPGPTLLMHDYTTINVTVVNELEGIAYSYPESSKYWNKYKDMDITNFHVHGLHVSPKIDDVLVKIPNEEGKQSHSYPYKIDYHYPGTFWYHAHHHVMFFFCLQFDITIYCLSTCMIIFSILFFYIFLYK